MKTQFGEKWRFSQTLFPPNFFGKSPLLHVRCESTRGLVVQFFKLKYTHKAFSKEIPNSRQSQLHYRKAPNNHLNLRPSQKATQITFKFNFLLKIAHALYGVSALLSGTAQSPMD